MGLGTLFLLLDLWAFLFIGCGKLNGWGEVAVNWLEVNMARRTVVRISQMEMENLEEGMLNYGSQREMVLDSGFGFIKDWGVFVWDSF